ncbi:MAG: N-acetylmuramoyl-L-alanine amidase [Flavobacteriales bacterium]|jgi:N-acetylmuramoyl-L-alanine amidase|nr:N-acetylmuramoyl-L-alanine amidase [Flavobacteriales bacterium]
MVTNTIKYYAKKRIFSIFLAFVALLFSNILSAQTGMGIKTVVIDPGHGGKDPGAIGTNKVKEKDVVLAVSLKLGALIKKNYPDVKVIYTRSTDDFIGLAERATVANKAKADLFISIHSNVAGNSSARGFEAWVLGLHKSEAALNVAKLENSSILMEDGHSSKYEAFDPSDPDAYIGLSMRQNVFLDQSLMFADQIVKDAVNTIHVKSRGVKQAGFVVLYRTTMPAVLIELGFLSNAEEEKFLGNKEGQTKLATTIFNSFSKYKARRDKVDGIISTPKIIEAPKEKETTEAETKTSVGENSIKFRVQIATSQNKVETKSYNFKGMNDVDMYISGKFYKYIVGNYETVEEAKTRLSSVKEKGYTSAFIIAFENGKRISVKEAIAKTK